MVSVLVTTREIEGIELNLRIADEGSVRAIPPANSLESCVRILAAAACALACVNRTWEVGGPRSGSCVWLGWLVARGPGRFSKSVGSGLALVVRLLGYCDV